MAVMRTTVVQEELYVNRDDLLHHLREIRLAAVDAGFEEVSNTLRRIISIYGELR